MIGVHLLLLSAVVAVAAPRVLGAAGWVSRSPRLGIAAWYAVIAAVMSAVAGAVVAVMAPWQAADAPVCVAWRWCVQAAQGGHGWAGRAAVVVVALVGLLLAARLGLTAVRLVRAGAARRRRHAQMLSLAGRPWPHLGAIVVDSRHPAAYVTAGHRRRVVVTTGALDTLCGDEVAAVLAHERAHAAGRHDLLLDGVRLLAHAFPRMAVFAVAHAQLGRLVEIRADEVATAGHAPISLARALVAMATANAADEPAPQAGPLVGAVAATGGNAAERLHRLLVPPAALTRVQYAVLATGIGLVALAPAALVAAAQVFPLLTMCPALPL